MQKSLVNNYNDLKKRNTFNNFGIAVTSAMRKNGRWSSMNTSNFRMGALGGSMGLRTGRRNIKDSSLKEVINNCF